MISLPIIMAALMAMPAPSGTVPASGPVPIPAASYDSIRIVPEIPLSQADGLILRRVEITEDILGIGFAYSGGCQRHTCQLVTTGVIKPSSPPQLDVYLLHDAHGDVCEAMLIGGASFNISSLKTLAGGTPGDRTLIINLMFPRDSTSQWEPLLYEF